MFVVSVLFFLFNSVRSVDRNPSVRSRPRQVHTDPKYQADLNSEALLLM